VQRERIQREAEEERDQKRRQDRRERRIPPVDHHADLRCVRGFRRPGPSPVPDKEEEKEHEHDAGDDDGRDYIECEKRLPMLRRWRWSWHGNGVCSIPLKNRCTSRLPCVARTRRNV